LKGCGFAAIFGPSRGIPEGAIAQAVGSLKGSRMAAGQAGEAEGYYLPGFSASPVVILRCIPSSCVPSSRSRDSRTIAPYRRDVACNVSADSAQTLSIADAARGDAAN